MYKLNKNTLEYEKIKLKPKHYIGFFVIQIIIAIGFFFFITSTYKTPREKKLIKQNEELVVDLIIVNNRLRSLEDVTEQIIQWDSLIYNSVFESKVPYYKVALEKISIQYDSLTNIELVDATHRRISRLENTLTDMYHEAEFTNKLAIERQDYLSRVPAIQPIKNEDLRRTASGWGWRIHPIYNIRKFHFGIDFSAKTGTQIFATGKGTIQFAGITDNGYGKVVIIDHGYGYKTLYGHMDKIYVKKGQEVDRGHVIGESGNTGVSTGPHVHYEVILYGKKVNPVNYFFNDLTPDEYDRILKISSQMNKTYD